MWTIGGSVYASESERGKKFTSFLLSATSAPALDREARGWEKEQPVLKHTDKVLQVNTIVNLRSREAFPMTSSRQP